MKKNSFLRNSILTFVTAALLAGGAALLFGKSPGKKAEPLPVVAKAPDFALKDVNNKEYKLSSYKGKVVLLNFFATWCPYCTEEVPDLIKLTNGYKGKNLVILSVNVQERVEKVKKFIKSKGANYTMLMDSNGKVAGLYKVHGIPSNFLIDKKGNLRFGENSLPDQSLINQLILEK